MHRVSKVILGATIAEMELITKGCKTKTDKRSSLTVDICGQVKRTVSS